MKANLFISGNVQGVGYRAHVRRAAHQHHIKGFVRNLSDGRVEVFAVYDESQSFVAFLSDLKRESQSVIGIHVESIQTIHDHQSGFQDLGDFGPTDDFQIRF